MGKTAADIKKYVENTRINKNTTKYYDMGTSEMGPIGGLCACRFEDGIYLAFEYGRAKGYRAAKAEARR